MTTTINIQRFTSKIQLSLGKRLTSNNFFHQDLINWLVNTLTIMVGMSSQQPLHLVPTERQESVRIRSCVFFSGNFEDKGIELKFPWKSHWKRTTRLTIQKACSTSSQRSWSCRGMDVYVSVIFQKWIWSFFFSFDWALDWRHRWNYLIFT